MPTIYEAMRKAYSVADKFSDDSTTKNGSVLLSSDGEIVAWGVNRFPRGVQVMPARLARPLKYEFMLHAEQDAIASAAERGIATAGLTMVCPWAACTECARMVIQSGISRLVVHETAMLRTPDRWAETVSFAKIMMAEAGIVIEHLTGEIGGVTGLMDGKPWNP